MSLLPDSTPDIDSPQAGDIEVLGLEERDTDEVFKILASETARTLLIAINDEPETPSELADRLNSRFKLSRIILNRSARLT